MSQIIKVKPLQEIKSVEALRAAVKDLGLTLQETFKQRWVWAFR